MRYDDRAFIRVLGLLMCPSSRAGDANMLMLILHVITSSKIKMAHNVRRSLASTYSRTSKRYVRTANASVRILIPPILLGVGTNENSQRRLAQ